MKQESLAKKVLITGGSGFVGQNIIHLLRESKPNYKIYNLSRTPLDIEGVENIKCEADTYDFNELEHQFDCIIHLLALSNEKFCEDFSYANSINVEFTRKVLDFALKQKNLEKFIHLSSIIIYDNKNTPPVNEEGLLNLNYTTYSFTKGISEYYANFYRSKFNLPVVIFRLSNIYGPYQEFNNSPFLVPSKIVQALTEKKIEVFNLTPKRDWIYSGDAAEAIVKAMGSEITGTYNLAGGKGFSVEDIVICIAHQLKVDYVSLNKPMTGPLDFYCDITKINSDLSWAPKTSLKDGMKMTLEYINKSLALQQDDKSK